MSAKGNPDTNVRDGQTFHLKLPKILFRKVSSAAHAAGKTINRWVCEALEERTKA